MQIGGYDLILQAPAQAFDPRLVLEAALAVWPEALFEDDTGGTAAVADLLARPGKVEAREFFVYRNAAAAKSWDEDGRTETNGDGMAHCLWRPASDGDGQPVTLVLHELTAETLALYGAVAEGLERSGPPS